MFGDGRVSARASISPGKFYAHQTQSVSSEKLEPCLRKFFHNIRVE